MGEKKTLIKKLELFKKRVDSDIPLDKLILFGSSASGKAHCWSDIDLIVVSRIFAEMDFFERGAKMYDYWNLKKPVDFLCYTPEEFEKLKKQITIIREAVREGIEIK
jgi:predicted nucleotidyltransferase